MSRASDEGEEKAIRAAPNAFTKTRCRKSPVRARWSQKRHISQLVDPAWEEVMNQREHLGEVLGIPTGIEHLDEATSGWRNGEMTYVGALPGRGKTSFMLQCVLNAAKAGYGVGVISLEDAVPSVDAPVSDSEIQESQRRDGVIPA